jgi:hypothetical protein
MVSEMSHALPEAGAWRPPIRYRPGDLVVSRGGYPTLYEVICICNDGLLRLRGVDWAVGYSALVAADQVRPTSGILHEE